MHSVELFLPERLVFRFIAHPDYPISKHWDDHFNGIHAREIRNGQYPLGVKKIAEEAQRTELFLLSNSNAHRLKDIRKR